ncbi:MAG: SRPBCC domain-containing protein [Actinomycetota bacterium]
MTDPVSPPVIRSAWVARPVADAFAVFTDEIGAWWPVPTHGVFGDRSGGVGFDAGRLVERAVDGDESIWAEVLDWDPPHRIELDWHPGRGADEATTVSITFTAVDDGTRVTIEHRGWERLGPDAIERRRAYRGPNAWGAVLDHFGDVAEADHAALAELVAAQTRFAGAASDALASDVVDRDSRADEQPVDGWDERRVVAHVTLNDLEMIRVCQALVHGLDARFENELAQSPEVLDRWVAAAGDDTQLLRRQRSIAVQVRAALARLSTEQLAAEVPCRLTSDGAVMVDGPRPWGAIAIDVQTRHHLPDHTEQLRTLAQR